jgi:hypothetical protein
MIEQIQILDAEYLANPTEENYNKTLIEDFYLLQSFYKTYMESIGLTITRDYYYGMGDEAYKAYTTHDYAKQIDFFNQNKAGKEAAFKSYQEERKKGSKAFGELLSTLKFDEKKIAIADGSKNLAINSLKKLNAEGSEPNIDPFLTDNPETIFAKEGIQGIEERVSQYLF